MSDNNQQALAEEVATLSYPLEQRARDQALAQQAYQRAMQDVHLLRRVRDLEQEKAQFETATAEQLRYVSPANPRGTPPPPRPQRPRSDDIIEQLMFDMDQASRLGVSMRLGDLRVYGSDGNSSAFEAMVQAGQQIQAMGLHVLNTGLMIGSFIPGPIGVLSNGISMMLALANGDEGTALEMGIARRRVRRDRIVRAVFHSPLRASEIRIPYLIASQQVASSASESIVTKSVTLAELPPLPDSR